MNSSILQRPVRNFSLRTGFPLYLLEWTEWYVLVGCSLWGTGDVATCSPVTKTACLRGSVLLTRYTSVSTTTWSLCGWATRNWQSKGMLVSVKKCSRNVLVSRNSSQIALQESVSTKAGKKRFCFLFAIKLLLSF